MQKGFIQIPVLIAIIVGLLVLGGGSYFGVKQYQEKQELKLLVQEQQQKIEFEKEKLAEDEKIAKEGELQSFMEGQQNALKDAQSEIEKLKEQSVVSKSKQESIEQKVLDNSKSQQVQDISITASELEPYLSGLVMVTCNYLGERSQGSGTFWKFSNSNDLYVLTNMHVVGDMVGIQNCAASVSDSTNTDRGVYYLDIIDIKKWNDSTDIAVLKVGKITEFEQERTLPHVIGEKKICSTNRNIATDGWCYYTEDLNYKISKLPMCPTKMSSGSNIIVVGFPAFGKKTVDVGGVSGSRAFRIVSEGVISGFDDTTLFDGLPNVNYFVSAKIDSGNSGGIAFAKNDDGLCVLGVPTWLTVGSYENQGLVQNIHNVMYIK